MGKEISIYLYLFVLFSVSGWLLEVVYRSWQAGKFINPGFLKGFYLPLYGSGALLLALVIPHIRNISLPEKALVYFIITTGSEFLTGFIFERFFNKRLWDYSNERLCIMNHVCLTFSLYWIMLAFACEYLFFPAAFSLFHAVPLLSPLSMAICVLIFIDAFFQLLIFRKKAHHKRKAVKDDLWEDFWHIVEPLLKCPEVEVLSGFIHHRSITRLDHSMEVAWLSYLLARRFSLEGTAAARGGLLHDLFYYEWLTEGPRLHGFRHPRICLENARQITQLSPAEEDTIIKHMWPLTFSPPRYAESWIVCFADTYCCIKDYLALAESWLSPQVSVDREL